MRFLSERKFLLLLGAILVFSSVMAVRQYSLNQSRHAELREALIFLHANGYEKEAEKLYPTLTLNMQTEPTRHLVDDLQRTSSLIPTNQSPGTNILVRYHLYVQRELELRFEREYLKARKLADRGS